MSCSEGLVSFGDLTPHAVRVVHANLQAGASFCRGFEIATWLKSSREYNRLDSKRRRVSVEVKAEMSSMFLHVATEVTLEYGVTSKSFLFSPSRDDFEAHGAEICKYVNKIQAFRYDCSEIAAQIHIAMVKTSGDVAEKGYINPGHLEIWRHNLQFTLQPTSHERNRTITIVYTPVYGKQGKVYLECIFASLYKHNPIKVIDDFTFQRQWQTTGSPDVFVFSSAERNCWDGWLDICRQHAASYVERFGSSSLLIMISNEPWNVDGLDESVVLVSTVSQVARQKHVYLPTASMVFGEGLSKNPMLLLESNPARNPNSEVHWSSRRFCAYMYARCDRPQREYMFDLLNAMEPVDALGVCQGTSQNEKTERWRSRLQMSAFQDAVDIYTQYKFVIAFENAQRPGYVTEKLVNAFLAGSIPIYLGHSDTISQLFNPKSFVDCGRFVTLRECALRVMEVHQSVELYGSMLREPVIGNVTRFHELFSWHPDVPSSFIVNQFATFVDTGSSRKN